MNSSPLPPDLFPSSLQEATQIQNRLAEKVEREDRFSPLQWVGGVDVSHNLYDPHKMIYAAMVVLDAQTLELQEEAQSSCKQLFPYIPGFLGFREAPVLVETFAKIKKKPQVILVDGHGIGHPRGLGIASHLGVLLDWPTIGVAKNILVGKPQGELGPLPFDQVPLVWKKKVIGILLRTRKNSHPIIISPGHRVSQESSLAIVKSCLRRLKLPEPTRLAHLSANACRMRMMEERKKINSR